MSTRIFELAGAPATADMFEDAITNAGGTD